MEDKWISVADKLPEEEERYLIVNHFKLITNSEYSYKPVVVHFKFFTQRLTGERIIDEAGITGCFMDDLGYSREATHWQPLPSPPTVLK